MNKFSLILLLITAINSQEECSCWKGYEAIYKDDQWKCSGIYVRRSMECNLPEVPVCECSSDATAIMQDRKGIWCIKYKRGREVRRWLCENMEEWAEYFQSITKSPTKTEYL